MKLKELIFEVKKQKDGWYIATADYSDGAIVTEAKDYAGLKKKIREAAEIHFNSDYMKEKGLIEMPKIKLHLKEKLFNKGKNEIIIAGHCDGMIYRALYDGLFSLNLSAPSLETLRALISEDIKNKGYSKNNNIVFSLEENL